MDLNRVYGKNLLEGVRSNRFPRSLDSVNKREIDFGSLIRTGIEKVNDKQLGADDLTRAMITGETDDLHEVILATEEARLSLELAVQLRNRCVEAFKELNNMQI